MKVTRLLPFLLILVILLGCSTFAGAEDSVAEVSADTEAPSYDYCIKYGFKPLVAPDGTEASNYITGKTPATAYLKAGENHVVSKNYYTFRDYVFVGWNSGGKLYKPGEIIYNVRSDMTLIAEWGRPEQPDMTVVGSISYSKGGKVTETKSVEVGSTVALKDGYWQDGYGRIFSGGSKFLLSFTTADFKEAAKGGDTVAVNYNGDGASDGIQCPFTVEKGGSFIVDGCYGVKEGYSFSGWSDGNGRIYTAGDTCIANASITLTAIWRENAKPAPDYCTVIVTVGEGGMASPEGKSTLEKGDSFSFTVSAKDGYKLISVTADGAELGIGGEYTLAVNGDMNIKAAFEKLPQIEESREESLTESITESREESLAVSETENSTDLDTSKDEEGGNVGRYLTIALAVVVCVGSIALAAWFSAKSNKKGKRR